MINAREGWTGYLWQGRFASFPMDYRYLRACVRYVGLNPVRSGICTRAIDWPWSSVRAHVTGLPDPLLTPEPVREVVGSDMVTFFDMDIEDEALLALRRASMTGRPLVRSDGDTHKCMSPGGALFSPSEPA
jgi:putative transposase